jgi:isocitrate dehydrogenase
MSGHIRIAVAHGDGIGKEIMAACLKIFQAAKVPLDYANAEMGLEVYKRGLSTGM